MAHSGNLRIVRMVNSEDPQARSYTVSYAAHTLPRDGTNRDCLGDRALRDLLIAMSLDGDRARQAVADAGYNPDPVSVPHVVLTTERLRELGFTV